MEILVGSHKTNSIFLDHEHKLAVCGDWCVGGRIEGAFTSAYNLSSKMKKMLLAFFIMDRFKVCPI